MLANIKLYGLIFLGALAAFFGFQWKAEEAKRAKEKLEGEKQAREAEKKANIALVKGLDKEEKAVAKVKADIKSGKRTGLK